MPLEIVVKGSDKRLLADHAVLVATLDESGNPVPVGGGGSATAANQTLQIVETESTNKALSIINGTVFSDFIDDTAAHAGDYAGIVAVTETVIDSITLAAGSSGAASLAGVTLAPGQPLMVPFTSVTLASGVAQLVKLPS